MGLLLVLASALLCSCKSADLLPSPLLSGSVDILHRFLFLTWCFTLLSRPKTSMQAERPTHNVSNESSIVLSQGLDLSSHISRWLVFVVHGCFSSQSGFGLKQPSATERVWKSCDRQRQMERVVFVITAPCPALSAVVEKRWEGVGEQGHTPPYPLR